MRLTPLLAMLVLMSALLAPLAATESPTSVIPSQVAPKPRAAVTHAAPRGNETSHDNVLAAACEETSTQALEADLPWQMPRIIVRIPAWVPRPRLHFPRRPDAQQPPDDSHPEADYSPRSPSQNHSEGPPAGRETQRPYDYEMFSNHVIHVPRSALPVAIYSNDPAAARAVQTAIDDWNQVGEQVGLGPMFRAASSPRDAQFTIDWSGRGLSGRVVGETQLRYSRGRARVEGVVMRPYSSLGNHAPEVLAHELGHALGLGHSAVRADLMYTTAHGYPGFVKFTARDIQMVQWLYSQSEYIPIGAAGVTGAD